MKKGYSDGPFGQLHWRMLEPSGAPLKPDLYCLHPAPFSGLAYTSIMPLLAQQRRVIAPDYPGYGGSDAFKIKPSVAEYTQALLSVIKDLSGDAMVDLTGFHTGNIVAIDLAIMASEPIRRLALVDVPGFDPETRVKYRAMTATPLEISADINCLAKPWDMGMTKRLESQGPDRSLEMFVEQLRHGKNMNAAFHAGFSYDVEANFPRVRHETQIMATQSPLLDASRRSADLIPGALLVERLDISRAVLDEAAEKTALQILEFLDKGS